MAGGKSLVTLIKEGRRDEVRELLLRYVTTPVLDPDSELALNAQNDKGDGTALHWASIRDWPEVIQFLLVLGACPDVPSRSGSLTPLHAACDHNASPDTIRQLLRKVSSVHSQSDSGDTPAHLAAYRGHLEPLRLLVLAGADLLLTNCRLHNVYEEAKDDHTLAYLHHLVLNERSDNSRTCSKRTQLENRVSDRRQMTPLFSDSSVDVTSLNGSQGLSSSSSNSSLVNLELTSSSNVTCQSSRHRSHAQPSLANRQPLLELSSNQSSWSSSRPSQQSVWSRSQNSSFDSDSSLSCLSSNTARTCCEQEDSSDSDM